MSIESADGWSDAINTAAAPMGRIGDNSLANKALSIRNRQSNQIATGAAWK
jgi:hypothetical protein